MKTNAIGEISLQANVFGLDFEIHRRVDMCETPHRGNDTPFSNCQHVMFLSIVHRGIVFQVLCCEIEAMI